MYTQPPNSPCPAQPMIYSSFVIHHYYHTSRCICCSARLWSTVLNINPQLIACITVTDALLTEAEVLQRISSIIHEMFLPQFLRAVRDYVYAICASYNIDLLFSGGCSFIDGGGSSQAAIAMSNKLPTWLSRHPGSHGTPDLPVEPSTAAPPNRVLRLYC